MRSSQVWKDFGEAERLGNETAQQAASVGVIHDYPSEVATQVDGVALGEILRSEISEALVLAPLDRRANISGQDIQAKNTELV